MTTSPLAARTVTTHVAAALLGVVAALAVQSHAQTSAETMLSNAPIDDLNRLRDYLYFKANDLQEYQTRVREQLAKLEAKVSSLEQRGQSHTVVAPFTVVDQQKRKILQIDARADGRGLVVYDAADQEAILLGVDANGPSVEVDRDDMSVRLTASTERTGLAIARATQETAFIGSEPVSSGFLRFSNEKGDLVVGLGVNEKANGELEIHSAKGTDASVRASANDNGGYVTVNDLAGKPFAGMRASAKGGLVEITGPTGQHSGARLSMAESGGQVSVFPANGGRAKAALQIDGDGGAVNLWDKAGTEIRARLTSNGSDGAGLLEIGNGRGDIVVSAGATQTNAVGFVSTGPYDGGVAGTMGGGLKAASTLLGSKTEGKKK